MAFKLTRTNHGTWTGTTGETVTVDVRSVQPATTVRISYGGKDDGEAPFQFDVRKGLTALLVVTLAVKTGQEVEIVEVDGSRTQVLRSFFWSKQAFFESVDIEGE